MAMKMLMMGLFLISENHPTEPATDGRSDPDGSSARYAVISAVMEMRLEATTAAGEQHRCAV